MRSIPWVLGALLVLTVANPVRGDGRAAPPPDGEPSAEALANAQTLLGSLDPSVMTTSLAASGLATEDVGSLVQAVEAELGTRPSAPTGTRSAVTGSLPGPDHQAAVAAVASRLRARGVPERSIHRLLWLVQDRRFPRVDPAPLMARLRELSLDPTVIESMVGSKVRVYARERSETAEAQYDPISNSLYLPPDYLEEGANPPRLARNLDSVKLNTVLHELDHAEKDLIYDDSETYGKGLWQSMVAGVRKTSLFGIGGGALALGLSAIPKLALMLPLAKIGLAIAVGSIAVGAAYGAYQHFFGKNKPPRDRRQEAVKAAMDQIAASIRRDRSQRMASRIPLTEARSKAWEVSGYFTGDSVMDVLWQLEPIKIHNMRRIRQAKTVDEVRRVLESLELPPDLANRQFGTAAQAGSAFFRNKEIIFDAKAHPDQFRVLYENSLGLRPPRDGRELMDRVNADRTHFPELRQYLDGMAKRRIAELNAAGSTGTAAGAGTGSVEGGSLPGFEDLPNRPQAPPVR